MCNREVAGARVERNAPVYDRRVMACVVVDGGTGPDVAARLGEALAAAAEGVAIAGGVVVGASYLKEIRLTGLAFELIYTVRQATVADARAATAAVNVAVLRVLRREGVALAVLPMGEEKG